MEQALRFPQRLYMLRPSPLGKPELFQVPSPETPKFEAR